MLRQAAVASVDMLPERFPYRDDGCEIYPSCLRCPLPQCKYDNPLLGRRKKRAERDREVVDAFRQEGLTAPQVAARFDMSQRTVFRIIKRYDEDIEELGGMALAA